MSELYIRNNGMVWRYFSFLNSIPLNQNIYIIWHLYCACYNCVYVACLFVQENRASASQHHAHI
jgi:hypothetical protein